MLRGLQKGQRRLWIGVALLAVVVAGVSAVVWWHNRRIGDLEVDVAALRDKLIDTDSRLEDIQARYDDVSRQTRQMYDRTRELDEKIVSLDRRTPPAAEDVYSRTLLSTAWVLTGEASSGTGTLIDRSRKLVVTAYHVIHNVTKAEVVFPRFRNGKVLAQPLHYANKPGDSAGKGHVIPAKVWASDPARDLAVLQLESLPDNVPELKLAGDDPPRGARVHTIGGHPERSVGLWVYSVGRVRETGQDRYKFGSGQAIDAQVVRTTNPINRGDSGGPLVNDRCELVGVTSGGAEGVSNVAMFISAREVNDLVRQPVQRTVASLNQPGLTEEEKEDIRDLPSSEFDTDSAGVQAMSRPASTLHALFLIDDADPNLTASVHRDFRRLRTLLEAGLPAGRYRIKAVHGRNPYTIVRQIAAALRGMPVGANDSLLCYYSGHGAFIGQYHMLCTCGGGHAGTYTNVSRLRLAQALLMKRARLTMLITDCCSNFSSGPLQEIVPMSRPGFRAGALEQLFFRHKGWVDFTAASPGQSAYNDVFTPSFCETCASPLSNQTWASVIDTTRRNGSKRRSDQTAFLFNSRWQALGATGPSLTTAPTVPNQPGQPNRPKQPSLFDLPRLLMPFLP
jgi:S1-C subfamily serine protease